MEEIAGYIVGHAEHDVACSELSWLVGIKSKTYRGVPANHSPWIISNFGSLQPDNSIKFL
ncbi:hypothetical protein L208DRAFT_1397747 [Tricholoma matsutake]|nr:hypothetical protein L208DRAFT_1397747 [Tricholoma matsutake 945]